MNLKRRTIRITPGRIAYDLEDLRGDIFGGVTAGLIMLPNAMAYGAIAGLGPVAGLWGSIAVGFFASLFNGTRGLISGPNLFSAISMAVVLAEYTDVLAEAMIAVILAGLLKILFGLLRLGNYIAYTSQSALSGFFTAVGVLIIAIQLLPFLGSPSAGGGVVGAAQALPNAVLNVNFHALAVGAITLVLTVCWRGQATRFVPAIPLALVVGTAAGYLLFIDAPVIGKIPSGWPNLQIPAFSIELTLRLLEPALIIALLGSITTLLYSLLADSITGERHYPNRILVGQGVGNLAAGLIGGMPAATSLTTFVNIRIGGRSPLAGIAASLVLFTAVISLASVIERVPWAVLAAILIEVGWDIIDWGFVKRIHRISRDHIAVMLITFFLALWVDFMSAIVLGLVVSGFVNARRIEELEVQRLISVPLLDRQILAGADIDELADPFEARVGLVVFPDRISVASAREVIRIAGPDLVGHQIVVFDFSKTIYVDDTASSVIGQFFNTAVVARSKPCIIFGLNDEVAKALHSLGALDRVPQESIVGSWEEAKDMIRPLLNRP